MEEFLFAAYKNTPISQIILEFIAFVFGIISVVFAKNRNILVYPTGLISTIITVYLLYKVNYFGDMTINIYYSIMSIYGWFIWRKTSETNAVEVSKTTLKENKKGLLLFVFSMGVTYFVYYLFNYSLEILNYIDIFTSGLFFVAMYFMAQKKIEHWILWIVADIITIPLYAYRGLGMLALQYLIFTILAIYGYLEWKKNLQNQI